MTTNKKSTASALTEDDARPNKPPQDYQLSALMSSVAMINSCLEPIKRKINQLEAKR